jgi:hypothetical protein
MRANPRALWEASLDEKIRKAIMRDLTVPLWPTAGRALGLGRSATYDAASRGEIPTIQVGRKKPVPTAPLRKMLGIEHA